MSEGIIAGERPRIGASFHPVPGGGVLFDPLEGRLYALSPTAGLTWLCITDGLSKHESTLTLAKAFQIDRTTAAEWFRISMDHFRALGLLETPGSTKAVPPLSSQKALPKALSHASRREPWIEYRLFGQILRVSAPPGPLASVASFLGALRDDPANSKDDGGPALEMDIVPHRDGWDIVVAGQLEATCATASIVAEVERVLVQTVVPATPHLLTLHAAALQRGSRTLLLVGPSGAGKTTLSLALHRAGWSFGADEIVLLGRGSELRALPLPPCVKADSFPLIEKWFPAELRAAPAHERYGNIVKYLPIRSTPISDSQGCVVFIRFEPGRPNEIQPMSHFGALERLLAQCVFVPSGFQDNDVEQLLRWHLEQSYFDLSFCDCDAAVTILSSLYANRLSRP